MNDEGIGCRRLGCHHEHGQHSTGGGRCLFCGCRGFLYVDPEAPASGYEQPPAQRAGGPGS